MIKLDLKGQKFGKLTVIRENGKISNKISWLCKCECGNSKTIIGAYLQTGSCQNCGCEKKNIHILN